MSTNTKYIQRRLTNQNNEVHNVRNASSLQQMVQCCVNTCEFNFPYIYGKWFRSDFRIKISYELTRECDAKSEKMGNVKENWVKTEEPAHAIPKPCNNLRSLRTGSREERTSFPTFLSKLISSTGSFLLQSK